MNTARMLKRRKIMMPYLMVLPTIMIVFGVLGYAIMIALKDSFFKYPLLSFNAKGTFVGFDNYIKLFMDPHFQNAVGKTFTFVFASVAIAMIFSFTLALSIYQLKEKARIFRTLTLIPYLISGVAAAIMWRFLFNGEVGFVNHLIRSLGGDPVFWLSNRSLALMVVTLTNVWKMFPMSTMLLLAGLQVIDPDIYDAATVDGSNWFHTFFRITLPLLGTYLASSMIWLTFGSFNMFDIIYPLTEGGPNRATEVMALYMYNLAFKELDFSGGSSVMILLLILNLSFSVFYTRVFKNKT
ncbi:MAG: sugar ABC transporter permease [Sphaerochaeta sp.]|nr:sugar ABC transporter permease [Sphaerochaeta sp.]